MWCCGAQVGWDLVDCDRCGAQVGFFFSRYQHRYSRYQTISPSFIIQLFNSKFRI